MNDDIKSLSFFSIVLGWLGGMGTLAIAITSAIWFNHKTLYEIMINCILFTILSIIGMLLMWILLKRIIKRMVKDE